MSSTVGQIEKATQARGVTDTLISRALHEFTKVAGDSSKSLYDRNRAVCEMLRYGIKVQPGAGENHVTVWLIDWYHPQANDFGVAEEVTVNGSDLLNAAKAARGVALLDLFINPERTTEQREAVLLRWYRQQLNVLIPPLVAQWEKTLGVQASAWGIKRMKTKWGSCNPVTKRLWFNLELAKKPVQCLEYIVAHELAHLLERNHTERFRALLDQHLPNWQQSRAVLNEMPLGHERW